MINVSSFSPLRDDIIFVVYLFQRWKYPTDMTRPNEYGQVFEDKKDKTAAVTDAGDEIDETPAVTEAGDQIGDQTEKSFFEKKTD